MSSYHMKKKEALSCVLYTRTSTKHQRSGHQAQERSCRAWVKERGGRVIDVFRDTCSGVTAPLEREGLMRALSELREGFTLVVFRRDRLGRDLQTNLLIEALITKTGAQLVSVELGEREGPEGALIAHLLDAVATYERALIRMRTVASIEARRGADLPIGPPPLGKFIQAGRLVVDEEERARLRLVLELRAQGYTLRALQAECAQRGLLSRKGRPPSLSTIARWCKLAEEL